MCLCERELVRSKRIDINQLMNNLRQMCCWPAQEADWLWWLFEMVVAFMGPRGSPITTYFGLLLLLRLFGQIVK